jgi:hypothetical protein
MNVGSNVLASVRPLWLGVVMPYAMNDAAASLHNLVALIIPCCSEQAALGGC